MNLVYGTGAQSMQNSCNKIGVKIRSELLLVLSLPVLVLTARRLPTRDARLQYLNSGRSIVSCLAYID